MSEAVISIKNASISQNKISIFKDISLEIGAGQFVYLIGKSGMGKTSLFRALYADLTPDEGEIEVCGFPLKKIKNRKIPLLRREIGIIFQDFQLLSDRNAYENLSFILQSTGWKNKKEMHEKIIHALDLVGLKEKADSLIFRLSEGEQQRLGIARAIINDPKLILADEPTGNLDPITSEEIIKMLLHINKTRNTTILIATHDYMIIEKFSSRIVCCENGNLIEG